MKKGVIICGPDVAYGPLALASGSFEEKLEKVKKWGYDGVELMVREPADLDWNLIAENVRKNGLEISQIVTGELFGADGLCLVTSDKKQHSEAEDRMRRVIDMAAYLDTMVNVGRVRGRLDLINDSKDKWETAVELLSPVMEYAQSRGVRIAMEPVNRYETDFINTVEQGLSLIEVMGFDNVGLMLDVFHMNIEERSIEDSLRSAKDKLWHVHIADTNRLYPGSGHLNFKSIFKTLDNMGYSAYLSAEIFPKPDPDTAAEKTIEFLRAMGF